MAGACLPSGTYVVGGLLKGFCKNQFKDQDQEELLFEGAAEELCSGTPLRLVVEKSFSLGKGCDPSR